MAYQCDRCNHWTANGDSHECINDELDQLKQERYELRMAIEGLLKTGRECANNYEFGEEDYYHWVRLAIKALDKE